MAQTGITTLGIGAVREDMRNIPMPEKAGQEFPIGAILDITSAGYAQASSGILATGFGVALEAAQDTATDGEVNSSIARFEAGQEMEGTFDGTLAVANLPGGASNKMKVTQTSGVPIFAADAGGTWRLQRAAPGWAVGDTNPRVRLIPMDSFIQAGGGNE